MKTSSKLLFLMTMLISTILVMNSNSWISMWMGLEMNLMSFIPLISKNKDSFSSQSTMMYFLVQSMASMMFLAIILTNKYMFMFMESEITSSLILITMMIKMGMPPFHMWFPEMMNKLSWTMCLILTTWQKMAPMFIISLNNMMNKTLVMLICLTTVVGAIGGLNQTSMRKIMAYSSINHMSWMIACAVTFKKSWVIYLAMYAMMMLLVTMMFSKYNIMYTSQMNIFMKSVMEKMLVVFMMLSMGGLPPFMGFIPKWISIQYMISSGEFMMMMTMVLCALVTLSYYLRMINSMNMMMSHSQKWTMLMEAESKIPMYFMTISLTLPMIVILMNFM